MDTFVPGRKRSPIDTRDYKLSDYIPRFRLSFVSKRIWDFPSSPLDQGMTSHCCGFSMASFGISSPVNDKFTSDDGHKFYYVCKAIDGEPQNEEGSTIRTVARALVKVGRISTYAFAYSPDDVRKWILDKGPVIAGTVWTGGMMYPTRTGEVVPTGSELGGHAYLINGYADGYYICQNSWGRWGLNGTGRFLLSDKNFAALFRANGEFIAAVELPLGNVPPTPAKPKVKPKKEEEGRRER
jgi:hypothetical protein